MQLIVPITLHRKKQRGLGIALFSQTLSYQIIEFLAQNHFILIMQIDTFLTADKIGLMWDRRAIIHAVFPRVCQCRVNVPLWRCFDTVYCFLNLNGAVITLRIVVVNTVCDLI